MRMSGGIPTLTLLVIGGLVANLQTADVSMKSHKLTELIKVFPMVSREIERVFLDFGILQLFPILKCVTLFCRPC